MMGIYFAMTGFGNKVAGLLGESAEKLGEYTIFTGIAVFCVAFGLFSDDLPQEAGRTYAWCRG